MKSDSEMGGEKFGRRKEDVIEREVDIATAQNSMSYVPRSRREQAMPISWEHFSAALRPRKSNNEGLTVMFSTQANRSIVEQLRWYAKEHGVSIVSCFEASIVEFLQRRGR